METIKTINGTKYYYKNGKLHRDGDLPAIEYTNGRKCYYKNGEFHRDGDLPAIEESDGTKQYWKNGIEYTKEQVKFMTKMEKKRIMKIFRYWYDKTYSDPNSEAFKARMERDMAEFENFAYILY